MSALVTGCSAGTGAAGAGTGVAGAGMASGDGGRIGATLSGLRPAACAPEPVGASRLAAAGPCFAGMLVSGRSGG
ncbi:MAG: hypothetical protein LC708_01685, partial [Actinobacteria bacterium]|nr:hypothetical protein [Actinomycetota bacterium]